MPAPKQIQDQIDAELNDLIFESLVAIMIQHAPASPTGRSFLKAVQPWLEKQAQVTSVNPLAEQVSSLIVPAHVKRQ